MSCIKRIESLVFFYNPSCYSIIDRASDGKGLWLAMSSAYAIWSGDRVPDWGSLTTSSPGQVGQATDLMPVHQ